jgi:hypothetical protein
MKEGCQRSHMAEDDSPLLDRMTASHPCRQAASLPPPQFPASGPRPPSVHPRAIPRDRKRSRPTGPPAPWRAGVSATSARSDSCKHPRRQASSLPPPERQASGNPGHVLPTRAVPLDRNDAANRASGPRACGRPCYPCSTLTHSNRPCAGPGRASAISSWPLQPSIKIQVHRSQAGTWFLTSDGSAGRASRPVVSAKVYFTTGDDRRSARQGTSPQDPEKYIKAGRHN